MHNTVMEMRNICNHPYLSQINTEEVCMSTYWSHFFHIFTVNLNFFLDGIHLCSTLQIDSLLPKHYLPPVVRLCGKMEMLDRLLPKLKATDHRVCKIIFNFWFLMNDGCNMFDQVFSFK